MRERPKGVVFIAPLGPVPAGRMVDPSSTLFSASFQPDGSAPFEDCEFVGADAAIAWGRERSDRVIIRLGDEYFAAGEAESRAHPAWPPAVPPEGWWKPPDTEEAWWSAFPAADGSSRITVVEPEIRHD